MLKKNNEAKIYTSYSHETFNDEEAKDTSLVLYTCPIIRFPVSSRVELGACWKV